MMMLPPQTVIYPASRGWKTDRGMNNARATIIERCFSLADAAMASKWTLHNSTEALFWFHTVLKIDRQNADARLGAAKAYQYVASQPWWQNDRALARIAAGKALAMVEPLPAPSSTVEKRDRELVLGQIYSLTGQSDLAQRHLGVAIDADPDRAAAHYFFHFTGMVARPRETEALEGLAGAVAIAQAEGARRPLAAAHYFLGFANTLFARYEPAIANLTRSLELNPGYGAANLALIAATALSRHKETYKVVRSFRERYPKFRRELVDYLWVERSTNDRYGRLAATMADAVKAKLSSDTVPLPTMGSP